MENGRSSAFRCKYVKWKSKQSLQREKKNTKLTVDDSVLAESCLHCSPVSKENRYIGLLLTES